MAIPVLDLSSLMDDKLRKDLEQAAAKVIASGWYILGKQVEEFEAAFANYCGTAHTIGVANGLDALTLTLRAWKEQGRLQDGDGVVVAASAYIACILAITENRLRPILVEPDPRTSNLSVEGLEAALAQKPKAVMAVHLYGQLCPMPEIRSLCDTHGLLLLEDCAQSHGATIDGTKAGAFGHAAGFSFYPTKNLGALGDAGATTTDDPDLARMLRTLRHYGMEKRYINDIQGVNSRLDEIQAAFLTVKLPYLDAQNAARRKVAARYRAEMNNPLVRLPQVVAGEESHVWHLFVVHCETRDDLARHLQENGVQTAVHYPVPPHRQLCYKDLLGEYSLPVTERLHRECLTLPISPAMTDAEAGQVIQAVNSYR